MVVSHNAVEVCYGLFYHFILFKHLQYMASGIIKGNKKDAMILQDRPVDKGQENYRP